MVQLLQARIVTRRFGQPSRKLPGKNETEEAAMANKAITKATARPWGESAPEPETRLSFAPFSLG